MNLEEIARLAGVSRSTVSRVLNKEVNVNPKTRQRVQAVIDAQNFQPNRAARALAQRSTRTIGVVISNNIGALFDTSFYFPSILRGIAQVASQRDYALVLLLGKDNEDDIRFSKRIIYSQMMDGFILVSPAIDHPLIAELFKTKTLFVSADRIPHHSMVNFVTVENIESSRQAVQHLINLGRQRIVMIAGSAAIIDSLDRVTGYRLALQDNALPYDESLVIIDEYSYEAGYRAISSLIEQGISFDGVYASQSSIAVGAVNAILDNGYHVPNDVALIAFDDLADSMHPRIGISTMRQPVFEKGQQLAEALIDLIEKKAAPPIQRFLSTELVIRDTCGGLKKTMLAVVKDEHPS